MGLRVQVLKFIQASVKKASLNEKKLNMVELGNQHMRNTPNMHRYYKELGIKKCETGKQFFSKIGYLHTSIDTNGRNGSLKKNLNNNIGGDLLGSFDVLTNSGTSEHVKNQYECFKNCHTLCKEESVMIHVVPEKNSWPKHGLFWYTNEFFQVLAEKCGYEIIESSTIFTKPAALVAVALKKNKNSSFTTKEEFYNLFPNHEKSKSR